MGQILAAISPSSPCPCRIVRSHDVVDETIDEFTGSTGDLVNVAIVVFVVFVFLQYVAGANGLFGSYGVFANW